MTMTTENTLTFMVTYTDPDRPVDGPTKTRHFPNEEEARAFLHTLDSLAPNAYGIKLERWETVTRKETLFRA